MVESKLRVRNKLATRALIVEVADRLFLNRGFEVVSLEEVANECEMSVRTVLRYFDTKESLALTHEYTLMERFRSGLGQRQGDVVDFWRDYTATLGADVAARGEWFRLRVKALRPLPLWLRMTGIQREQQQLLAEALAAEERDGDSLRPHLMSAALVTANYQVVSEWIAGSEPAFDPDSMQAAIDYVVDLFARRS